jgi:hypothetical protein
MTRLLGERVSNGMNGLKESCLPADLRECMVRTNPEYEIVLLEQLPAEQQEPLSALRNDPGFYGFVRTRAASGLSTKSVSRDTAALLNALKKPGRLPEDAIRDSGEELAIIQLVWDGVLQVAHGADWVCGPDACGLAVKAPIEQEGALADLSLLAVQDAAALRTGVAMQLCGVLYRYNTLPIAPQWLRRIPGRAALEEFLQIGAAGRNRGELDRSWVYAFPVEKKGPWLAWISRRISWQPHASTYKLYLSPLPGHLREAFRVWLNAISTAGAFHFKIGSDVRGLLRPDKMVAYFTDRDALEQAAALIAKELSGCPAQGVPFTAELNCGALMSWGADPPLEEAVPAWLRHQSWRQWVCNRLGAALAVAKHHESNAMPAWRFALERLRLDGVDVNTWAPMPAAGQPLQPAEVAAV